MTRRELLAALVLVATTLVVTVVLVVVGTWVGALLDDALSATIGHTQSTITGWVILVTLLLCSGDVYRQRRWRNR